MTSARQVDDKCEFAWETLGQIMIQRDDMAKAVQAFDKVSIYQDLLKYNSNIVLSAVLLDMGMSERKLWFLQASS